MLSIMAPEEPGLDIAGPTAESKALYLPPGTIISRRASAGPSRYIFPGSLLPVFPMAKFPVSNTDCWDRVSSRRYIISSFR